MCVRFVNYITVSIFSLKRRLHELEQGFTLVELLVVIAIISILATVLLLQLGTARAKARDAKRVADINQVRSALELYFDDNATYPQSTDMSGLAPKYLVKVPLDPLTVGCAVTAYTGAGCYGYAYNGTTKYQIWATLEQANKGAFSGDADINSTSGWSGNATKIDGASEACITTTVPKTDCYFDLGQN